MSMQFGGMRNHDPGTHKQQASCAIIPLLRLKLMIKIICLDKSCQYLHMQIRNL
jgi:hypothetical protein